jgi:hypothetical protein
LYVGDALADAPAAVGVSDAAGGTTAASPRAPTDVDADVLGSDDPEAGADADDGATVPGVLGPACGVPSLHAGPTTTATATSTA